MHEIGLPLSAQHYLRARRRWRALSMTALLLLAATCTVALGSNATGYLPVVYRSPFPVWMLLAVVAPLLMVAVMRWPLPTFYLLVFSALVFEQWPIDGLSLLTERTHLFQTVSGFTGLPLPVSPAEVIMVLAFAAMLLSRAGGLRSRLVGGRLAQPMLLFMLAVVASLLFGLVNRSGGSPYLVNVAWEEARSFVYMALMYFLAVNLITTRKRLETLIWVFIAAVGCKGLQGVNSFRIERSEGLRLEAITGHEDVIFFGLFFMLLLTLKLYRAHPRQRQVMLWLLPAVLLTEFATSRRLAFLILPAGLVVVGITLWQVRRALFLKVVPVVLVLLAVYTVGFWNRPDTLAGQPVRAFRSQLGFADARDARSNEFRDLEKININLNIHSAPLTGLGFGRPYTFYVPQPDISSFFQYWNYMTHNAIFWVWMKMGLIGFTLFWYLLGSAIALGMVTFRQSHDGYLRAIAICVVVLVVMQVFFSYGDLGLTYARPMILLGAMLGVLARLPALEREPAALPGAVPLGTVPPATAGVASVGADH